MKSFARQALILPAIIGVLTVAGVGGAVLSQAPQSALAAEAPAAPPPAPGAAPGQPGQPGEPGRHHTRFAPGKYIEGRIAFLQAELKITPAQKAQWDKVATVMRENAKSDAALFEQAHTERGKRSGRPDAVTRMNDQVKFSEARLASTKKLLEAFTPFYQSLSDEQKKVADDLFGHRGFRMRG